MQTQVRMRQLVDWRAAIIAGIVSGIVFLIVHMLLFAVVLRTPFVPLRILAAFVMGDGVLPPPPSFDAGSAVVGIIVLLIVSILLACFIALILHRWGMLVGIIGGALWGAAFYFLLFYGISLFFPWLYPLRNWMTFAALAIFGATAGGVYEALEVETYVPETT